MKKLILATLALISFNALAVDVKVLGARYNPIHDSIEVEVSHQGGCEDDYKLKLRGCADLIFPHTCQVDVVVTQGESCDESISGVISYTREELGMKNRKFSQATLIIQDQKKKTNAKVILPIHR